MVDTIKISQLPGLNSPTPSDLIPLVSAGETRTTMPGNLSSDWRNLLIAPTLIASYGQREQLLRYSGVDYSGVIPVGGKIRVPRTGTTPTTSMAFVSASSQYASKASPTGLNSILDDYTIEASIYLDSYGTAYVLARTNGTSQGFGLSLTSIGQPTIFMWGRDYTAYQSIPLNKWVHIAGTMDASSGSGKIYIDGVDVPTAVTGTATAITQGGSLVIGKFGDAASGYFNGKVANVRLWSAVRTAAEIRDNMNKETPASTTGLAGHWKGNGSWNDSSVNANNLTAANGAVNNFASHPYSATEYAIATKVQYTGGNTDVTVFTGQNCIPNETLGSTSYSTARTPYGFPAGKSKWSIEYLHRTNMIVSGPTANAWYSSGGGAGSHPGTMTVPSGDWTLHYEGMHAIQRTANTSGVALAGISTAINSAPIPRSIRGHYHGSNVSNIHQITELSASVDVTNAAITPYYLVVGTQDGSVSEVGFRGDITPLSVSMECAYL